MAAARPVVKWAGGKSRLLDDLVERLPAGRFKTYAEPFVGGGAMFFSLAPRSLAGSSARSYLTRTRSSSPSIGR